MGYEFPASVERYAEEAHLSPAEAAVQLLQAGLEKARKPVATGELSPEEWERLRAIPFLNFLWSLPDDAFDSVEATLRERRGEAELPRG